MKFKNISQVDDFIKAVEKCKGEVILTSQYGDRYNLKSDLSRYVAIGALLGEHGDELELFCANREDEGIMMNFLLQHPSI